MDATPYPAGLICHPNVRFPCRNRAPPSARYSKATITRTDTKSTPARTGGWTASLRTIRAIAAMATVALSFAAPLSRADPAKPTIILVHGAWADGSSWSKVIPLLLAKGLHVVAAQIPLTSLADDVACTERAIALQDGSVVLVGHSYGGGGDHLRPGTIPRSSDWSLCGGFRSGRRPVRHLDQPTLPPAPLGGELRPDAQGFWSITPNGVADDIAQDRPEKEIRILTATQGPTNGAAFGATVTTAAWKAKPSWFVIASNDRAIPPELEKSEAATMKATSITLDSSHVAMLSHPKAVAEVIEQAAGVP